MLDLYRLELKEVCQMNGIICIQLTRKSTFANFTQTLKIPKFLYQQKLIIIKYKFC